MIKYTVLILFFLFSIPSLFSQKLPVPLPPLPPDWQRIYIKNVGSFDLPPTLEIQAGKYQEFVVEMKRVNGIDASKIVAQQKGLNSTSKNSFTKYARLLFDVDYGNPGDYQKLNFNITSISLSEKNDLNISFKQGIIDEFRGTGLKLIEWYPLQIERINGMSCYHYSYKRQLNDNPFVLVNIYIFQNYDSMYRLTLSYRISESDYWKSDFSTMLKSFRVSNIK